MRGDFRHLDEIHSAFSPSYQGDIFLEREAAWKSRNQVRQLVADFPGLDCGSKYCCPARPHQPSPPPIDCKSQTDFSPLPSGPDNSCKFLQPRNEKEIIRPRMGTWGGSVHSYIRAMTNIANSADVRMTVSPAVCAEASSTRSQARSCLRVISILFLITYFHKQFGWQIIVVVFILLDCS